MCGISGFIDYKSQSSEKIVQEMIATLAHRGPDGEGVQFIQQASCQLGLAHKRLSIIDLSSFANQPFHYGNLTIIFNGEIYNYKEIKKDLADLGHQFQTSSDTEMIVHAYREWGIECVHRFIGMFVIVLYDQKSQEITIIRDRAGVKPLYYYWNDGLFLFSSELKSFHKHPRFQREIDFDALALFLKYCYIPAPHAIFKNTYKLLPGHFLKMNLKEHHDVVPYKISKYWDINDLYTQPKVKIDENEVIDETEKVLKKAFDYRMVADVPVGVFLSGGYDSSAVTALLQQDSSQKIKTFTIGFHESKYNEAPYAKEVANYLGTDHTEYYCTVEEAKQILPQLPYFYDEPFGDSSAIPTILVSQLAKKSVTVALSADGGDEIFGGYYRYPIIQKMEKTLGNMPAFTRKLAYQGSLLINPERIPVVKNKPLVGQRFSKFRSLIKEADASRYLKSMCSVMDDKAVRSLLQNNTKDIYTYFDEKGDGIDDILDQILAKDFKTYMVDDILTKVDRATMSVALEGREPFLDPAILRWAASLPTNLKIRNGNKKYILKEIVHRHLPKKMMDRPKWGFAIPMDEWFRDELEQYFELYFSESFLKKQGIFHYAEIQSLVFKYRHGKKEYITQLWNILMFQLWYEKWMK